MRARGVIALGLLLALLRAESAAADGRLAVIVHPDRLESVDADALAQIYLKKRRFWSDGDPIVAVNRPGGSPARVAFSDQVFPGRVRRLRAYWNRQYFDGVLPPATLASDEAVKRFVALEPNAIGYVAADLVDDSVRVLLYLGSP